MGKLFSGLKKGRLCDPLRRFFFMINGLKKLVEFYLIGCFLKLSKYSIKVEKLSDLFRIVGSRYFCERFFRASCSKNQQKCTRPPMPSAAPIRPASLATHPTRGVSLSFAMTLRRFVKPAFSLRFTT